MRIRVWLGIAVAGALALTLIVSVTSLVSFAYRSPSLHVAVETAAALISLLAAQLMYGRFRRSLERSDLLLTGALVIFAGVNLLFSAVPAIANADADRFATWASALAGLLGVTLLALGAFATSQSVRRPGPAVRRLAAFCVLALAAIAAFAAAANALGWLPLAIDPTLSPDSSSRPRIVGSPILLGLQLVVMSLFALAALGFARLASRRQDMLMLWFAIGATLAAFARLNYFLFPSRFSDYFYTGDVLWLGFFIAVLIGVAYEIRGSQRELEHAAAIEERRRLARDIHDGVAQDLAFIVQQTRALEREGANPVMTEIAGAARHALDELRGTIAGLVRSTDEPLELALTRVALDTAGRWGSEVQPLMTEGIVVPAPAREALLRIVGEAVTNAARHGQAQHISIEFTDRPHLLLRIADDGIGFDPSSLNGHMGRHGIAGMRERAQGIGAQFDVQSRPGEGTRVVVTLP